MKNFVLGITGASGSIYAIRLLQVLGASDARIHVVVSGAAQQVMRRELDVTMPTSGSHPVRELLDKVVAAPVWKNWGFQDRRIASGTDSENAPYILHGLSDYSAGIASGSFRTDGMVVCPCSMGTLSSVANGTSTNLIQRAADVHLKERRPLIIVPRESPLGRIGMENMLRLHDAGATILPSMPGFYHAPKSVADLVDFVVGRITDQLGLDQSLYERWGDQH